MPFLLSLVAVVLLVCGVWLRRGKLAAVQFPLIAWGFGLAGIVSVDSVTHANWLLAGIDGLLLLSTVLPPRWLDVEQLTGLLRRHRAVRGALLSITTVVVMLGAPEWAFCLLDLAGIVKPEEPIKVVLTPKVRDWRLATILYKECLVDPVVFWRPAPNPPYNEQGFKGPVMSVPKPRDVVRVMCYGDSNTDGPPENSWATLLGPELQALAGERRVESINAGVAGYTSYQGMRKFEMDVDTYRPDMVLVSFGWNDPADATGKSDKEYLPPSPTIAKVQRVLYRTRSFRTLMQWLRQCMSERVAAGPRVSVEDYKANLRTFAAIARRHGVKVVLLTRPHGAWVPTVAGWRSTVPQYNAALREVAAEERVHLLDAQKETEEHLFELIDECHFAEEGHRMAARVFALKLVPLL
jgi:lysophospholipase L1-like esterase